MRLIFIVIGFFLLSACINKKGEIKIDKFIWIQHNRNFISNPKELQARVYLEYIDSCNKIKLAKTNIELKKSDYFINVAPDSLRCLIIKNLYLKNILEQYDLKNSKPPPYDGDFYCIIYKFGNGEEKILNIKPNILTDSLRTFFNYLDRLTMLTSYVKTDSFDRISMIDKYSQIIISEWPFAPRPALIQEQIKFEVPENPEVKGKPENSDTIQ